MKRLLKRAALSLPFAALLTIVLATTAFAHAWPISSELSMTASYPTVDVATDGATHSVATFVEWNGSDYSVKVDHSGANGWSWEAPLTLSTAGWDPAVSGYGQYFDVVWSSHNRVKYARSTNHGVSFGPPINLTRSGGPLPLRLSVAHGADGVVVVAWQQANNSSIKARVSTNDGSSFGSIKLISSGATSSYMGTSAAVGDGVIYVAYSPTGTNLYVARSTDGGATWGSTQITANTWDYYETARAQFSLTAVGTHAYIAYTIHKSNAAVPSVRYKRTTNSGARWSAEFTPVPRSWKTWEPDISLQGGVVRLMFTHKAGEPSVHYRQSSDGVHWSTREEVSLGDTPSVGYAGNIVAVNRYIDPYYGIIARAGN